MKLMHLALCSSVSFFAGLVVVTGGFKGDIAKTLGIAGLAGLPLAYATHLITDGNAAKRQREVERKLSDLTIKTERTERDRTEAENKLARLTEQLEESKKSLSSLKEELAESRETLAASELGRRMNSDSITSLQERESKLISKLESVTSDSTRRIEYLQSQVNELKLEIEQYHQHFEACVKSESDKRADELFQVARVTELEKIYQQHDEINSRAMTALDTLKAWGFKAIALNHEKHQDAMSLAADYNRHIDQHTENVNQQVEALVEQLDACNMRVGLLQHELAGDLVQPVYGEFGHDRNGQIANAIAEIAFRELNIPLAVKGFTVKPDGAVDIGCSYSRSIQVEALVSDLSRQSAYIAKRLGIHKITSVRKLEIADLVVLTFRREPALKADDAKLLAGSPEEFISYITNQPIRYRLIGDPGQGKTPTTAVMVSAILKAGCHVSNVVKHPLAENTLVTYAYPGATSSLKDTHNPLELFLKYGDTTAAIKSFKDACADWEYRKQNVAYADKFFQLWVWDELDNTIDSADDPKAVAANLKLLLKQGGHQSIGYIVSGQSVMTKQTPGLTIDDRSLIVEIIIGIPKIRHYLKTYGQGKQGENTLKKLAKCLEELEPYIEDKNELIVDDARQLRLALVLDQRSPKLYFLPNLDSVHFDTNKAEETLRLSEEFKTKTRSRARPNSGQGLATESQSIDTEGVGQNGEPSPFPTIGGSHQSDLFPHCPHCGSDELKLQNDKRYQCSGCKKRFIQGKAIHR